MDSVTKLPGDLLPGTAVDGLLPQLNVKTPAVTIDTPILDVKIPAITVDTPILDVKIPAVTVDTPILDVSIPQVEVTITPDQRQQPILDLPEITVEITTEIPTKIELPTIPVSIEPNLPETPAVIGEKIDHLEETPVIEPHPAAEALPESISNEAPVPSLIPAAAEVPAVSAATKVVPATPVPTVRHVTTKPHRNDKQRVLSESLPGRTDPIHRGFTPSSTAVTSSAPTRSASTYGPESGGDSASAGLLFPVFGLQPPNTMGMDYLRSQVIGFYQWSKPPPTEPPRYTLLLNDLIIEKECISYGKSESLGKSVGCVGSLDRRYLDVFT